MNVLLVDPELLTSSVAITPPLFLTLRAAFTWEISWILTLLTTPMYVELGVNTRLDVLVAVTTWVLVPVQLVGDSSVAPPNVTPRVLAAVHAL